MNVFLSLGAVLAVMLAAYVGTGVLDARFLFGTLLPYAAIATFLIGFIYRIVGWAKSPVPFRIPTTCGQQKSLEWISSRPLPPPPLLRGPVPVCRGPAPARGCLLPGRCPAGHGVEPLPPGGPDVPVRPAPLVAAAPVPLARLGLLPAVPPPPHRGP